MSFGKFVDKLMGPEVKPCDRNDARVLELVQAGVSDLSSMTIHPDTKLSEIGNQKDVQLALGNLSHLYIREYCGGYYS